MDRVGGRGERGIHVAAPVSPAGEHVAVELPDSVLGIVDRRHRVGQRAQRPVGDLDELGCLPGSLPRVGDDKCKDITQIGRSSALGYEHRPVGVDDPDPQVTRDVGSREHSLDAGHGARRSRIDLEHVGPGVVRKPERSVKHARNPDVVHIVTVAERELDALVPGASGPEASRGDRRRRFAACQHFHRVEDLAVTGAAAQMRPEIASSLVAGKTRSLLVDERFDPHENAGRAETALQGPGGGERGSQALPLGGVEPLQGGNRPSSRLLQ